MTWWKKLFGVPDADEERVDYYHEGVELLQAGRFDDALTSFRLALKESPGDAVVLQQIAITYTRMGMVEQATKTYRHVLQKDPSAPGAHYGLAYLLLRSGQREEARWHLEAFLANPPDGSEAQDHIAHARATLGELGGTSPKEGAEDGA